MQGIHIPLKKNVTVTSDVDGVNTIFGYWGPFSYPMRARIYMVLKSMPRQRYKNILEVGYGCGILLPELYKRCSGTLYGIDIHPHPETVYEMLEKERVPVNDIKLSSHGATALPFPSDFFDCAVSLSVLEHMKPNEAEEAIIEIKRVVKQEGDIILGFPTRSIFVRMLSWIQRNNLEANHPSSEKDILSAVKRHLKIKKGSSFPLILRNHGMHINLLCRKG